MASSKIDRLVKEYVDTRAAEYEALVTVLAENEVSCDVNGLYKASATMRSGIQKVDADWIKLEYSTGPFRIQLPPQSHSRPRRLSGSPLDAVVEVAAMELVATEDLVTASATVVARFPEVSVDFAADVRSREEENVKGNMKGALRSAWHIDTVEEGAGASRTGVHPTYHFQMGGHRLSEFDAKIDGVILTEAPRLPTAPMEVTLALDFVLSHYQRQTWNRLCGDYRYRRLLQRAVDRYFVPYYSGIAGSLADANQVLLARGDGMMPSMVT